MLKLTRKLEKKRPRMFRRKKLHRNRNQRVCMLQTKISRVFVVLLSFAEDAANAVGLPPEEGVVAAAEGEEGGLDVGDGEEDDTASVKEERDIIKEIREAEMEREKTGYKCFFSCFNFDRFC